MKNLKKLENIDVSTNFANARKKKIMFYLNIIDRGSYLFLTIFKHQTQIQNPMKHLKWSVSWK